MRYDLPTRQGRHNGSPFPLPDPAWRAPSVPTPSLHLQNRCSHSRAQETKTIASSMPAQHLCMSGVSLRARGLALSGTHSSPSRTCPQLPGRPVELAPARQRTQGIFVPRPSGSHKATPSISAAPLRGLPSPCNAHTNVVSDCQLPAAEQQQSVTLPTFNHRQIQISPTRNPNGSAHQHEDM